MKISKVEKREKQGNIKIKIKLKNLKTLTVPN